MDFVGQNITDKCLIMVIKNFKIFRENKNWILTNQDKYGTNTLMYIILYNKTQNLGITKSEMINILDKFDLTQVNIYEWNVFLQILYKNKSWGFTNVEILKILSKFDLTQRKDIWVDCLRFIIKNNSNNNLNLSKFYILEIIKIFDKSELKKQDGLGWNILMEIVYQNEKQKLGFSPNDVLNLLDKFDLSQKTISGSNIYDLIMYFNFSNINYFNKEEMSVLVSKLDLEEKDQNNNNIFMKSIKEGITFNSRELNKKILDTKNKKIIYYVYAHISQISWEEEELLLFIHKNKLEMNEDILSLL